MVSEFYYEYEGEGCVCVFLLLLKFFIVRLFLRTFYFRFAGGVGGREAWGYLQ